MLLRSMNHYLLQALEVINLIEEDDYVELVKTARSKTKQIQQVCNNIERGSPFLTIFFVLELYGEIADENDQKM